MLSTLALLSLVLAADEKPAANPLCELRNATAGKATSTSCISCHDGSIAPVASFTGTAPGEPTHPVDINYAAAALRRPDAYTAPSALPRELVLTNGLVTCATCHSASSTAQYRLAMSMDRSALCTACHRM